MSKLICNICGEEYECNCRQKLPNIEVWRKHTDTFNCYKIYTILNDYHEGEITKDDAKIHLNNCDLSKFDNFPLFIQNSINFILGKK
jgi:transcription elongation factor Elf1